MRGWLILLALVTAGCSADGAAETEPTASGSLGIVTSAEARETIAALCELQDTTDPTRAEALFLDRVHEGLHAIAAAVQEVDRAAAGRLLEAKERVESEVGSVPESFSSDARELTGATREGLRRVGLPAPACHG